MIVIETKNLKLEVNKKLILSDINIVIPRGCIYGLIGANGSGKSTLLKSIVGLIPSLNKFILINEKILGLHQNELLKVGTLIESSSYYDHLTAYDNLKIYQTLLGLDSERIGEILEDVGLINVHNLKVKNFSMGMKQRLGIGITLLNDPEIFILDEPYNGLDQEGIRWLNELILKLKNQKKTILITSHVLSEFDKIVTKIGMMKEGQLIFQRKLDESFHSINTLKIKVNNQKKLIEILDKHCIKFFVNEQEKISFICPDKNFEQQILNEMNSENILIIKKDDVGSLEEVYFSFQNK